MKKDIDQHRLERLKDLEKSLSEFEYPDRGIR
jgi:hypothetical protein